MSVQWWSWLLTAVGVFGLYLAGRRNPYGWAVGLFAQTLWIAYATATKQYGFYASALAYGWVYAKNFRAWRVTHPSP
jgi:nicotinamide riboside transporter PnuC